MKRSLLDTHVLIWWMADDPRLSEAARETLRDRSHALFWSVASTWELAINISLGKLHLPQPLGEYLRLRLAQQRIELLAIGQAHAIETAALEMHHRDPFDRMLVAQARVEAMPLLSGDPMFRSYPVDLIW